MRKSAGKRLAGVALAGLCCGGAAAADLSSIEQWTGYYPSDKLASDKPLWDQKGVQEAMRAAMGNRYFAPPQEKDLAPEAPVANDGNGHLAAWTCSNREDCSGNNITVYFNAIAGIAQVCFRSSEGTGGKVQDLWLDKGEARALPLNGCGVGERDPFAPLKKYGAK
jgi:hypothetical protein